MQWLEIKKYIRRQYGKKYVTFHDMWSKAMKEDEPEGRFKLIFRIVRLIMVIPIHTAECERGFSLMGNIKNDWRSRLTSDTVTALMTIKLSEEAVDKCMIPVMLSWSGGLRVSSIDGLEQNHMDLGVKMILLCKNLVKILIQTLVMNSKGQLLTTHLLHYHCLSCIYLSISSNTICARKNIKCCMMHRVQGAGGTS